MANDLNFVVKHGLNVKEEAHITDFLDADGLRYPENGGTASEFDVIVLTGRTPVLNPDPLQKDAGATTPSKVLELQRLFTTNITEGTNLYYTDQRVRDAISLIDSSDFAEINGTPGLEYDSATGQFTYHGPNSQEIRQYITAGTGVTYDEPTGTVSIGQPVETTSDVQFNKVTLTGDLVGPATMCIDPGDNGAPAGTLVIKGNLEVNGTTTTINTTQLDIEDNIIVLNKNVVGVAPSVDAGIEIQRGNETNVTFLWDETNDCWTVGNETFKADTVQANTFTGNSATATELANPLTLDLAGDVTGSVTFNGTEGTVTLTTTIDGSLHTHTHDQITDWDLEVENTIEAILSSETGFGGNNEIDINAAGNVAGSIVLGHGTTTSNSISTSHAILSDELATLPTRDDGLSASDPDGASEDYPDGGHIVQFMDLRFDDWGHLLPTSNIVTTNLDERYYTKFSLEDEFVNQSGDWMHGDLKFNDNIKAKFGNSDSDNPTTSGILEIFYDASINASRICSADTGGLFIESDDLTLRSKTGSETYLTATVNNGVALHWDNTEHFATDAEGVNVTGQMDISGGIIVDRDGTGTASPTDGTVSIGDGADLKLWHDGTNTTICNETGELYIDVVGGFTLRNKNGEEYITADKDGGVELYYDDVVKLTTDLEGVNVTDRLDVAGTSHLIDDVFIGPEPHVATSFPGDIRNNTTTGEQIFHLDVSGAALSIGKNDSVRGLINLYGNNTGSNGGRFRMFNSGAYDRWTVPGETDQQASEFWHVMSSFGEFRLAYDNELRHSNGWGESALLGAKPFEGVYLNYGSTPTTNSYDNDTFAQQRRFQTIEEGVKTVGDHFVWKGGDGTKGNLAADGSIFVGAKSTNTNNPAYTTAAYGGRLQATDDLFELVPSDTTTSYDADHRLYYDKTETLNTEAMWTVEGGLRVKDNDLEMFNADIRFDGTLTTTDQDKGIYWTAFDKEGTTDGTDTAHIRHTGNTGGFGGSVLELCSMNDANDGIAFKTNGASYVTHNSHRLFTDDYHPNADRWTTTRTLTLTGDATGQVDVDGTGNMSLTVAVVDNSHNHVHTDISDWDEAVEDKIGTRTAGGTMIDHAYNDTTGVTTFTHSDTSTLNGAYGQTGTEDGVYIKSITVDDRGHLTAITTDDFDDRYDYYDYWTVATSDTPGDANVNTTDTVTFTSGDYQTITRSGTEVIVTGEKGNYVAGNGIQLTSTGSTGDRTIEWSGTYTGNVAITGDVSVTGDISATGTVCSTSDRRVKDNIKTIENALDKVDNLRGVSYTKDGKTEVGVIAQEVEEVVPEVVQTNEAGMKSVAYGNLVGVLIESVKELKAEIEDLRSQLNSKNGDE